MNNNHFYCALVVAACALVSFSGVFAQDRPVSTFFYDNNGNLTTSVDGLNRATAQQYDALNRLRRITQPPPGAMQLNPVIQFERNGQNELTRIIDPRNLSTTYAVDGLGNVNEHTSPDTGLTVRTYRAGGQVASSRDARGKTTTYTYDALNRLTRARYDDGTASRYIYDEGINGKGRLTSMTDPGGVQTSWTYDPHGQLLSQTQTVGPRTHSVTYSYNNTTGQRLSMTYPSGKVVTYVYGATSKDLEAVQIDGATIVSNVTYHPFGGAKSFTLGNGRNWSNTLDQDGRVATYTLAGVTYTVNWDAANRITRITSPASANDQTFGYDNLDRLTGFASSPRSQAFAYDLTGNLLAKSDVISGTQTDYTYSIDPASNRMTGIANLGVGYSFDQGGNRIGDGRITYVYNARGRLSQVVAINGATTQTFDYVYNGLDLRVRKKGPNTVIPQGMRIFVYDEGTRLIGEYDNLGRARADHIWLENRPVAVITYSYSGSVTTPTSTTISYVESDHLGTPRLVTNGNKKARWSWTSAPYGDTMANESPTGLNAFTYNLRFAGQYFDAETNHHYNHHRDYESTSGRYVQSDPIGIAGGINTYGYGMFSPLVHVDPYGLNPLEDGRRRGGIGIPNPSADAQRDLARRIDQLFCPPDCWDLQRQIQERAQELRDRYFRMLNDPRDLFVQAYCQPSLGRRIGTWLGHGDQIAQQQKNLQRLIAEADARNCPVAPHDRAVLNVLPPPCPAAR